MMVNQQNSNQMHVAVNEARENETRQSQLVLVLLSDWLGKWREIANSFNTRFH